MTTVRQNSNSNPKATSSVLSDQTTYTSENHSRWFALI